MEKGVRIVLPHTSYSLSFLKMPPAQTRRWCFTLNNPTDGESQLLAELLDSEHCDYAVVGREVGDSNTPHLQGYVIFTNRKRFRGAKALLGDRVHLEPARGNDTQASQYCKKDGDFDEYGSLQNESGKRTDWETLKDYILAADKKPTETDIIEHNPSLYGRYRVSCMRMVEVLWKPPPVDGGELREWQRELERRLDDVPDDRRIEFVIDSNGGKGKSWFAHYYWRKFPDKVQRFEFGKRDDYAYALDPSKSIFLFDVPRGKMDFFSYGIAESIKNKFVFSGKYDSTSKYLPGNAHVVVFSNEYPDMTKLSMDRYIITNLND